MTDSAKRSWVTRAKVTPGEFCRGGHRPMTADEAERLKWGELVSVLDSSTGDISHGHVHRFHPGESVDIKFRSGAVLGFDFDNPDFWPDDFEGERNPPLCEDGNRLFVLVTTSLPVAVEKPKPLFNALKASVELLALRAQVKRITDDLQGRPTREEHDAVLADLEILHQQVRSLFTPKMSA